MSDQTDPVIVAAEARATADVATGIQNLKAELDKSQWPWERQVLQGHLRRLEAAHRA